MMLKSAIKPVISSSCG